MSYDQSKVAFVDTETTGLDPELHAIWEIAVIVDGVECVWQQDIGIRVPMESQDEGGARWRDRPFDSDDAMWEFLAERDVVSPWVVENIGIRERYDRETALTPADSIDRLARLVGGRHLIGACPWFDSERLHRVYLAHYGRELGQRDLPWHCHLIDVENLAVGYLHGLSSCEWPIHLRDGRTVSDAAEATDLPWKSTDLSLAIGVDPADFEPKHSALADARWAKAMYEAMMGGPS